MADNVSKKKRSEIMSKVKSSHSSMEELFCKELRKNGYKFKRNVTILPGKPDIVFNKKKTVIFLDSCFWHGCKKHCRMPSSRKNYWVQKIFRNIKRDKEVNKIYRVRGWKVLRIWEHELGVGRDQVIRKLKRFIK